MRWSVLLVALLVPLAGCLGGDDEETPTPTSTPRPGVQVGTEDAALSTMGRWSEPFDGQVPAVNMVLLHDGRILYWSGIDARLSDGPTDIISVNAYPNVGESRVLALSPDGPNITVPGVPDGGGFDLFCSGQTVLPDGRVLIAGGTEWHELGGPTGALSGVPDARIYDPATGNWTLTSDMSLPRWYTSILTNADGRAFSIGGIGDWADVTQHWPSWESYDPSTQAWNAVDGTDTVLPLYPRTYQVAGGPLKGQFFTNTVGAMWAPFGEHPMQWQWSFQWAFDAATGAWTNLGLSQYGGRSYAGHAMLVLEPGRDYAPEFLTFGGTFYQTAVALPFAEVADLSTDPPTNTVVQQMANARWATYGVTLLDGSVLALGGAIYDNVFFYGQPTMPPLLDVERFDPATGTWSEVAPMDVERVYHSTALLLPDGRVLVGGHVPDPQIIEPARDTVNPQIVERRLQIYEPGYLFRGDRPVIVDAPGNLTYGSEFTVDVELPADLDSFLLVRPGATTHGYDGDNRLVRLETVGMEGTNVTLRAPPDAFVAPPGHYMLFALSQHADGPVPSEAVWIYLPGSPQR